MSSCLYIILSFACPEECITADGTMVSSFSAMSNALSNRRFSFIFCSHSWSTCDCDLGEFLWLMRTGIAARASSSAAYGP